MNKAHGPEGIRVWQGYRAESFVNKRDKFINALGELFIPATVQMMEPIGLRSYFPTILPDSDFTLPDEIALVAYGSQNAYEEATKTTTAGRAYGALHAHVFNFSNTGNIPPSKSAFPIKFEKNITFGQPYYLCDDEVDWRDNKTHVYCAKRLAHISSEEMLSHIEKVTTAWQKQNVNVNGSILVCEQDFVLYWEHSKFWDSCLSLSALFPFFAPVLEQPIISGKPVFRSVPPLNTFDYKGMPVEPGISLDVRLADSGKNKSPIARGVKKLNQALN